MRKRLQSQRVYQRQIRQTALKGHQLLQDRLFRLSFLNVSILDNSAAPVQCGSFKKFIKLILNRMTCHEYEGQCCRHCSHPATTVARFSPHWLFLDLNTTSMVAVPPREDRAKPGNCLCRRPRREALSRRPSHVHTQRATYPRKIHHPNRPTPQMPALEQSKFSCLQTRALNPSVKSLHDGPLFLPRLLSRRASTAMPRQPSPSRK